MEDGQDAGPLSASSFAAKPEPSPRSAANLLLSLKKTLEPAGSEGKTTGAEPTPPKRHPSNKADATQPSSRDQQSSSHSPPKADAAEFSSKGQQSPFNTDSEQTVD